MSFPVNGQKCSVYQGQIAYALKPYAQAPDSNPLSDETIGCIIGFVRSGIGSPPISYHDLVPSFQRFHPTEFAMVTNDSTQWGPKARQIYRSWMEASAQVLKRLKEQGRESTYLDTGAGAAAGGSA